MTASQEDKVVMISGANRGLGATIARRLAAGGYRLSLGARQVDSLTATSEELGADRALVASYDATDPSTAEQWIAATVERFGRIDALINNAGIMIAAGLEELDDDALDEMWAVNVKGPLRLTRLALPYLRVSGSGRILNVASMAGKRVKGTFSPGYSMTKHAVVALSHATRQLGWEDGVRVTALCPGPIATGMVGPGRDMAALTQPEDLADLVATVIALPNTASVAELLVNCNAEYWS